MKNIRKKVRFHFNLKSKHLLVIMTFFCGSCIVATAASGTSSAPLQEAGKRRAEKSDQQSYGTE